LICAWAVEMTPEGLTREKDVDRSQSITTQTGRKLDRVIIGVLAVAVVYLLVDKLLLRDLVDAPKAAPETASQAVETAPPPEQGPSVAVLPFVNMSGDTENEYFSDGLTETLLHMLSQLPGMRVAARTSSFAFKGQNADIGEIAAALGVAHVLEGSVQKANDRVRVTAQLIRADDGFHVWSQNYTRPLEDIFAIQDEIATDVAEALGASLLGAAEAELHVVNTTDLTAYDSYLKGLEQQAKFSYGSLAKAESHFKEALASDPGFTDARLALARNHILKHSTGLLDDDEVLAATGPLFRQVREREPDNPLARALELTLGLVIFDASDSAEDVMDRVRQLQDLLQVLPTETLIHAVVARASHYYLTDEQRALEVLQAGLLTDPLAAELHRWQGRIYADSGRLEEARAALMRALELAPDNPNVYGTMAELELAEDNLPAVLDWTRQASQVDRQDHELAFQIARDFYQLELEEEGDYWLARVQALAPGSALDRSLQVERAAARGDSGQVIAIASAMIRDQVEERQGAFGAALYLYADAMLAEGRAREAHDFLVSVRPEISDYDQITGGFQGLSMQWAAIGLMSGFDSFENRRSAWNRFTAAMDRRGFPWREDRSGENITWDLLMNGQLEQAIENYLEIELRRPLADNLDRHRKRHYAMYAPIYEDPRVAAALNEEAERFVRLREDVRAMLQRPEWENP
jgi:TolB-like protein/Tfp pilus assembly protein PilF